MQDSNTIIRQPIFIGLLLSVAVHAAILHSRSIYAPPIPHMETGRTTIQLTLLPFEAGVKSAPSSPEAHEIPDPVPAQQTQAVNEKSLSAEAATPHAPMPPVQTEALRGITSSAVVKGSFHPVYPRISRQRGEEGTVTLLVRVLPDGTAGTIEVAHSSGHRRLDRAAVTAAEKTAYDPARILGQTVESEMELSYTYRLTND